MTYEPHSRNHPSLQHFCFLQRFFALSSHIEVRHIVYEAGQIVLFVMSVFIRIIIFPFQLVIFIADFAVGLFTLGVIGLILALWFGAVSPGAIANTAAAFLTRKMDQSIVSISHWAANHPRSTLGHLLDAHRLSPSATDGTDEKRRHRPYPANSGN